MILIDPLLQEIFSEDGSLARLFGAFETRHEQFSMAELVLKAYQSQEIALIEAGTGVGKSLAYLVPAVIWALKQKEKTVISTHTIALQEQLLKKDIPFLLKALKADLKAVLVKGMNNYLCLKKLEEHSEHRLAIWAKTEAKEGCRTEIDFPLSSELWDEVKAESLSCNHVHCPRYRQCFFFKARKEAADAQILIVNHSLLLTDLALKKKLADKNEEKSPIPSYQRLIIDEAHHFEQIALECLSHRVDGLGLLRVLSGLFTEKHRNVLKEKLNGKYHHLFSQIDLDIPAHKHQLMTLIDETFKTVKSLLPLNGRKRLRTERKRLKSNFDEMLHSLYSFIEILSSFIKSIEEKEITLEINNVIKRLEEAHVVLTQFFEGEDSVDVVRLAENSGHSAQLIESSLDVSKELKANFFNPLSTAILCSATMTTNHNFSYLRSRLGIDTAEERIFDSPFDYNNRTFLAIPTDMPDPSSPQFYQAAAKQISEMITLSQGGAFILCTSYDMLNSLYELVAPYHDFPFLRQQEASRSILIERFKAKEGSVLFGTDSFWEGVDVPGRALRCVIIVKLPFKVPTDPIEEAYKEMLLAQNKDPFMEKNIPEAIVKFKQGFGRLMRTKTDYGCIACLDNRLITKHYGKFFLNSLPSSPLLIDTSEKIHTTLGPFYSRFAQEK